MIVVQGWYYWYDGSTLTSRGGAGYIRDDAGALRVVITL